MTATALLLTQRSRGEIGLRVESEGIVRRRESGAAKVRFPQGGREAILINTGGGLAGGDEFRFDVDLGQDARLAVTTQAAERVYRTLGPAAEVRTTLRLAQGAWLSWLPQETILFDGAALTRRLEADLAPDARLLAAESLVFGRVAMGERIAAVRLSDRWRFRRAGHLIFADELVIDGALPRSPATLAGAGAMATVVLVAEDAAMGLDPVREALGPGGGASAWNGKLVARLLAHDGFGLRKLLIPVLGVLMGGERLPKVWSS